MRLTVLGGSAAAPNADWGCSGYLLANGSAGLVLDLGPGTFQELRLHTDYRTLDAVVVSHLHVDHLLDLFTLRNALAYNPVRARRRLPIWLPPGGIDFLRRIAAVLAPPEDPRDYFDDVVSLDEYDPAATLPIADLAVSFTPTVHYVPCWAIRVDREGDGRGLCYTADTGPAADLVPFATGAEVLIAEAAAIDPAAEPAGKRGHLTPDEAGRLARDAGVETLILTHVWQEFGVERAARIAGSVFGGRIERASPGTTVEF